MECVTCVCVWLGAVWVKMGGEWTRGVGLGFSNPVETGGVLDVCLCFGCGCVGGVGGEWVWAWTMVWRCYVGVSLVSLCRW